MFIHKNYEFDQGFAFSWSLPYHGKYSIGHCMYIAESHYKSNKINYKVLGKFKMRNNRL